MNIFYKLITKLIKPKFFYLSLILTLMICLSFLSKDFSKTNELKKSAEKIRSLALQRKVFEFNNFSKKGQKFSSIEKPLMELVLKKEEISELEKWPNSDNALIRQRLKFLKEENKIAFQKDSATNEYLLSKPIEVSEGDLLKILQIIEGGKGSALQNYFFKDFRITKINNGYELNMKIGELK